MKPYFEIFDKLKCSKDVLDVVLPISSGIEKEISESMAIIKKIKPLILKNPNKYNVLDLCAGNPITSIITSFLFPIKKVIAVDKFKVERDYKKVRNFKYIEMDIFNKSINSLIDKNTIIIAIHPCGDLAEKIISIYKNSKSKFLFLIPCCEGRYTINNKSFLRKNLGNYLTWVYHLSNKDKSSITIDKRCLSERNSIICFRKEN